MVILSNVAPQDNYLRLCCELWSVNLEEIYRLVEWAENAQADLEHETATYDMYLEMFYGDEGHEVSKRMLLDETESMAETLKANEETLEKLNEARQYLMDRNEYRDLAAGVSVESLESQVNDLIDSYQDSFYDAMDVASRPEKDASMPGPITMKSMDNLEDGFDRDKDLPQMMWMFSS